MNRTCTLVVAFALAVVALSAGIAAAGDVNVNIGWPPPLIIEKPRVVMVPETQVYRAPNLEFNVFMFGGKYYSLHNDRWFMTVRAGAPWTPVVVERIQDDGSGRGKGHDKGCPPGLAKQGRC